MTPERHSTLVMWLEGGIGVAGGGFAWGQGRMDYRGVDYSFGVSRLSVEDADAVCIYAIGRVTYLSRIADFDGFYLASGARSSTAGGGHATHLRNERGVARQPAGWVARHLREHGAMVASQGS
jgi:hypothetical protein